MGCGGGRGILAFSASSWASHSAISVSDLLAELMKGISRTDTSGKRGTHRNPFSFLMSFCVSKVFAFFAAFTISFTS